MHAYNRIESNNIVMAEETPQLAGGFYALECGGWAGDGVRWTGSQARMFLRRTAEAAFALTFYSGRRRDGQDVVGSIELAQGEARIRHSFQVSADAWHTVTVDLPEEEAGIVEVLLSVQNVLIPAELSDGHGDRRELGIAIRQAQLL